MLYIRPILKVSIVILEGKKDFDVISRERVHEVGTASGWLEYVLWFEGHFFRPISSLRTRPKV